MEGRTHLPHQWQNFFNCPGSSLLQLCFNANTSSITEPTPCPRLHLLTHDEHHTPLTCVKCRTFYDEYINMSTAQLEEIEKVTKAQSKEQVWHDARRVRITASMARKCPFAQPRRLTSFCQNTYTHPSVAMPQPVKERRGRNLQGTIWKLWATALKPKA